MNTNPGDSRLVTGGRTEASLCRGLSIGLLCCLTWAGALSAQDPSWESSGPQLLMPEDGELIIPDPSAPLLPSDIVPIAPQNSVISPNNKKIVVESPIIESPTVDSPVEQPAPVVVPQPPTGGIVPPGGLNGPGTGYWVISSRRCPPQGVPENVEDCLEFFHQDDDSPTLRRSCAAEFYGSLQPGVPVCFFIHGSMISYEIALRDGAYTYRWLKAAAPQTPFHLVVFTWPADENLTYIFSIDATNLGLRAEQHGGHLARVITRIPATQPVSLIGHSHGGRLAASTVHLLGGGMEQGYQLPPTSGNDHRIRTVLAAAAIDHHWLNPGERYDMVLPRSESLINIVNSRDIVLGIYPLRAPFTASALGRSGLTQYDRWQLGNLNSKIQEFNVVSVLGMRHLWPAYTGQPSIGAAIAPYVFFSDDPSKVPGASASPSLTNLGEPSPVPMRSRAAAEGLDDNPIRGLNLIDNSLLRR